MQKLAAHAADDGARVFPGLRLIAHDTGYSERQVKRVMSELVKIGALVLVSHRTRTRPNEYRIDMEAVPPKPVSLGDKLSPDKAPDKGTLCPDQGTSCPNEGTFAAASGDICDSAIRKNSHEPSRNLKTFSLTPECETDSDSIDPRHSPIRELIKELHLGKFRVVCRWTGREGKALGNLLADNPRWTEEQLLLMVRNRFDSDGVPSDRPAHWLSSLDSFAGGALDRWGKVKGDRQNGNGNQKLSASQIYEREREILRARA